MAVLCLCSCILMAGMDKMDRFKTYKEMVGHDIQLYNIGPNASMLKGVVYDSYFNELTEYGLRKFSNRLTIRNVIVRDKKAYLEVSDLSGTCFYLMASDKFDIKANARSVTYWDNLFIRASKYNYVSVDCYLLKELIDSSPKKLSREALYLPVSWDNRYEMPLSRDSDVEFLLHLPGGKSIRIKAEEFIYFEKDFHENNPYCKDMDKLLQAENVKLVRMDSSRIYPAMVKISHLNSDVCKQVHSSYKFYNDDDYLRNYYADKIPFAVFAIDNDQCKGVLGGMEVCVNSGAVCFTDVADSLYLVSRGMIGFSVRQNLAEKYDEVELKAFLDGHEQRAASFHAFCDKGEAAVKKGEYKQAEEYYNKAVTLRPDNTSVKQKLEDVDKLRKDAEKKAVCIKKYGTYWGNLVYKGEFTLGMTTEMCYDIAGKVYEVNKWEDWDGDIMEHWSVNSSAAYLLGSFFGDFGLLAAQEMIAELPDLEFRNGKLVSIKKF